MRSPRFTSILLVLLFVSIGGYTYLKSRALIEGPQIVIDTPMNGTSLPTTEPITIRGVATHVTSISLNDRQIFVDANGAFSEEILLPEGYTIVTMRAEDRFGRVATKRLDLYTPHTTL